MPNGIVEIRDRSKIARKRDCNHDGRDVALIPSTNNAGEPNAGLLAAGSIFTRHLPQGRFDHTMLEVFSTYSVGALGLFTSFGGLYPGVSFVHHNDPAKRS